MRVSKAGGKEQAPGKGYESRPKRQLLGRLPAPAPAAAAAPAPACCYRRNTQPGAGWLKNCIRRLLPGVQTPSGKRQLRAALRPACGAGCARRGGRFAPAGAGKGNAACGRDGHTGEHPARVKYTACGGSCLMISGAARAGHGDATRCGRITYDPHPTERKDDTP